MAPLRGAAAQAGAGPGPPAPALPTPVAQPRRRPRPPAGPAWPARLLLAVLLAVALGSRGGPAAALTAELAGEPIRVLAQSHENRFPSGVRFAITAEADAPLVRATVYYRLGDRTTTGYSPVAVVPGRRVEAEHFLDLRRHYSPPGVELRYRWRLEDEGGRRLTTEWRTLRLDDPRIAWQSLAATGVELWWQQGDAAFGEELLGVATRALRDLREEAGVETGRVVRILVYGVEADFRSAVDPSSHEWAGGTAFTDEGVVLILASPDSLDFARRAVAHELSHVVVYQATRNPYGGLPNWLDEGLATLAEGEPRSSYTRTLQQAVREDRLISVWSLSSRFPTDARAAQLSYAQSHSLVRFVLARYGRQGMARLLAEFREGSTYDDALRAALGVDTYGLDDEWRASLGLGPAAAATPAASGAAGPARGPGGGRVLDWALGATLLVSGAAALAAWRRRARGRATTARRSSSAPLP